MKKVDVRATNNFANECDLFAVQFLLPGFYYHLTRAASSQGMRDESGAKSGNFLVGFVYVVPTLFSVLFS